MATTSEQATNILVFLLSSFIIGILTAISFVGAFAVDEGTASGFIAQVLYHAFLIFRFPMHNLIWLKPELIGAWFVPGLFINIIIYGSLTTFIISKLRNRKR